MIFHIAHANTCGHVKFRIFKQMTPQFFRCHKIFRCKYLFAYFSYICLIPRFHLRILNCICIFPPIIFHKIGQIKQHAPGWMFHAHSNCLWNFLWCLSILIQKQGIHNCCCISCHMFCQPGGSFHAVPICWFFVLFRLWYGDILIITAGK